MTDRASAMAPLGEPWARADANGKFRIIAASEEFAASLNHLHLLVWSAGAGAAVRAAGYLQAGERDLGDLLLEPGAAAVGRLVDAAGSPLAGRQLEVEAFEPVLEPPDGWQARPVAQVTLEPADTVQRIALARLARHAGRVTADAQGRFRIAGAPPGQFTFVVDAGLWRPDELRGLELRSGVELDVGLVRLAEGGTISGRVVDERGAPVADAPVAARMRQPYVGIIGHVASENLGRDAHTDDDGAFVIRDLLHGTYQISATAPGLDYTRREPVPTGSRDLLLVVRPGGRIVVDVVDARTGAALDDAELTAGPPQSARVLTPWGSESFQVAPAAAAMAAPGRWEVGGALSSGTVLVARRDGYGPGILEVPPLASREEIHVVLPVPRAVRVHGLVRDTGGRPVPGATVQLATPETHAAESTTLRVETDDTGHFELRGVGPGSHRMWVTARSHASTPTLVLDIAGEDVEVPVTLRRQATVGGTCFDSRGLVVAGSRVHLAPVPGPRAPDSPASDGTVALASTPTGGHLVATVDAQGRFLFPEVHPGLWLLAGFDAPDAEVRERMQSLAAAAADGVLPSSDWRHVIKTVTAEGERLEHDLVLVSSGSLAVEIRSAWRPEPSFAIVLVRNDGGQSSVRRAEWREGERPRFERLLPGLWHVAVGTTATAGLRVQDFELRPGAEAVVVVEVSGATLRGVVLDEATGAAAEGARIRVNSGSMGVLQFPTFPTQGWQAVRSSFQPESPSVVTGPDGRFVLPVLLPGRYQLHAEGGAWLSARSGGIASVTIEAGRDPHVVQLLVRRGAVIEGSVHRARPIAGTDALFLECHTVDRGGMVAWIDQVSDDFRFEGLLEGTYFIQVRQEMAAGGHHLGRSEDITLSGSERRFVLIEF